MVQASMTFIEEWFHPLSCERLAELGRSVADVRGDIVEIGSWEGRSTIALADAVHPRWVHAVDTWEGSPGEISAALAAERDVYATFTQNVKGKNIDPYRMDWRAYQQVFMRMIALVFIDAEHTYREVFDTIQTFLPYVNSGGVICGDDAHHPPIQQALKDCFDPKDVEVKATVWSWRKP